MYVQSEVKEATGVQKEQTAAGAPISTPSGKQSEIAPGIRQQGMMRETSGLLMEGTGEPNTVDAKATLVTHQERLPIDHSADGAAKPVSGDKVDYVSPEESAAYKERVAHKDSRQP